MDIIIFASARASTRWLMIYRHPRLQINQRRKASAIKMQQTLNHIQKGGEACDQYGEKTFCRNEQF
jgi:hypothetical protein